MIILGIEKRSGKHGEYLLYHLGRRSNVDGYIPSGNCYSRDDLLLSVGDHVSPVIDTYNGQTRVVALDLIGKEDD